MQIAVIGTGYVGLVSGACFAEYGFHVACVDKDGDKIAKLQQQIMPIFEPRLESLVESNRRAGRLSFSTDLKQAVASADAVIIAVGTPPDEKTGLPDLRQLDAVAADVAKAIGRYTLLVIKSTVPVGTNRRLARMISQINPDADFDVVSNPEFLREGSAVEDFMSPDRIVAGIDSRRGREGIAKLCEPIRAGGAPLFFTTLESAEMIKYAANCLLATRIAFINEIADFCEKTGANIRDVARGVGMDSRIGDKFLKPGPGFGGSCFPKDALALQQLAREHGMPITLIEATVASNNARKARMARKIIDAAGGSVAGKSVAVLGLTFKPGTDDMRESPSLVIVPALQKAGALVRAYDPQGMKEAARLLAGIDWRKDACDALDGADLAVVLTEWSEFKSLDLKKVRRLLKTPLLVDLRNIYKRQDMMKHGFHYVSVGRQDVIPGEPWIPDLNIEDEKAA